MHVKTIVKEDFVNYKKPSMLIGAVSCNWKCCSDVGKSFELCQNSIWYSSPTAYINDEMLCKDYLGNPLTSAIVFGGLEPLDQFDEIVEFIELLREVFKCEDDVVIYTGYNKDEISDQIDSLRKYKNIIVKFGRYVPNQPAHYDEVLGVYLASDNQYAEQL